MPRYHFNVHNGYTSLDADGTELPDWRAALSEAIRLSGMILADDHDRLVLGEDWRMEVLNETGLMLFRLDLSVMESPALRKLIDRREKWLK